MQSFDITDQVLSQLEQYATRIAYLESVGDTKSANVLRNSAQAMAEYADAQEEWIIVSAD